MGEMVATLLYCAKRHTTCSKVPMGSGWDPERGGGVIPVLIYS